MVRNKDVLVEMGPFLRGGGQKSRFWNIVKRVLVTPPENKRNFSENYFCKESFYSNDSN